jgi:hypothetical protein
MNLDAARYELVLKRLIAVTEAETSMLAFTQLMMPSPRFPDDPDHSRYEVQRFHRVICAALEELAAGRMRRLIINLPPRHGKTQLASKMFIAWFAGLHHLRHLQREILPGHRPRGARHHGLAGLCPGVPQHGPQDRQQGQRPP